MVALGKKNCKNFKGIVKKKKWKRILKMNFVT